MAPVCDRVSDTDPAPQSAHVGCPAASWKRPASHAAHATSDDELYCPDAHAVQLTAPVPATVSVTEPATHVVHADCAALP